MAAGGALHSCTASYKFTASPKHAKKDPDIVRVGEVAAAFSSEAIDAARVMVSVVGFTLLHPELVHRQSYGFLLHRRIVENQLFMPPSIRILTYRSWDLIYC